jgi:riboflavin synthase
MFTGIVEERAQVASREGATIAVRSPVAASDAAVGDSIAIDGVCLTVVAIDGDALSFELSPETLDRTTLTGLEAGDPVNVERPATLLSRLGGHLVQGHVDGVAAITDVEPDGEGGARLSLVLPGSLRSFVVEKGSIAVDGVSLTVAAIRRDAEGTIEIALIPHTMRATTLGEATPGDRVNVEVDLIAKYVARQLARAAGSPIAGGDAVTGKERTA